MAVKGFGSIRRKMTRSGYMSSPIGLRLVRGSRGVARPWEWVPFALRGTLGYPDPRRPPDRGGSSVPHLPSPHPDVQPNGCSSVSREGTPGSPNSENDVLDSSFMPSRTPNTGACLTVVRHAGRDLPWRSGLCPSRGFEGQRHVSFHSTCGCPGDRPARLRRSLRRAAQIVQMLFHALRSRGLLRARFASSQISDATLSRGTVSLYARTRSRIPTATSGAEGGRRDTNSSFGGPAALLSLRV